MTENDLGSCPVSVGKTVNDCARTQVPQVKLIFPDGNTEAATIIGTNGDRGDWLTVMFEGALAFELAIAGGGKDGRHFGWVRPDR